MLWYNAWRPENLWEEESGNIKVGVGDQFGSKSGISEIMTFSLLIAFLDRFQALNCSWVLAGANFIALRRRVWYLDVACRDDSCCCAEESYKQSFCHGAWSRNFGRRENPRHGDTFRVIARDQPDGFR